MLYLNFTSVYCDAEADMRRASRHCLVFRQYLDLCSKDAQPGGRDGGIFTKGPINKIQEMAARESYTQTGSAIDGGIVRKALSEPRPPFSPAPYSSLPFMELFEEVGTKLNNGALDQHLKRRLDIAPGLAEWLPRLKDWSTIQ